jgi:hypothetical protein
MNTPKLITHGGVTLNLATIKAIKLSTNTSHTDVMVVEHKKRYDYIKNKATGEYEKQEYNETTEVEYPSYDVAEAYRDEWVGIWQEYLNQEED